MRKVLITGTAGFIGFHLARLLLDEGFEVVGFDGMTDYYDVTLKERRHQILLENQRFSAHVGMLEDFSALQVLTRETKPSVIVHLAAQAGVRYSLEHPRTYVQANIVGAFNVLECAREVGVDHLLIASTSSVYGANALPFGELQPVAHPMTLYAATKVAGESMAHSYAHLWNLPTTVFRFFTVYGPWGRPDMALFKFTRAILNREPIELYNGGRMYRDFTYVTDLVRAIRLLMDTVPVRQGVDEKVVPGDSLSPIAPYRVVNIGNGERVLLSDFVDAIERECGTAAVRAELPMQKGDVPATWADTDLLMSLTGYTPSTGYREGVRQFVEWYRAYYGI